ncbi:MAG: 23S rRNA (uracil(1939)-C(5))-methyltransferase RlmD [Clostridia bacterium]|nr:23S rRNA (uracil(1939)-C(5))-methyltransferase RlmD [Clostridia bacterium]
MNKNQQLELECLSLGAELEGVCRHEGMAVFVKGMLPGEKGKVVITKVEKRYAFGRLLEVLAASPERLAPSCPAYPRCGGCSGLHMTYQATLNAKRQQVQDVMKRIGGVEVDVRPVLGMADPWHYRNKTALPLCQTEKGVRTGFYAPRSHSLIPVDDCLMAMEPINRAAKALRRWMDESHTACYDEASHTDLVRHLVARQNRKGDVMAVVVINGNALPGWEGLLRELQKDVPTLASLYISINKEKTNVILGRQCRLLWGVATLEDTLCGLQFQVSPQSFFQVNPEQTEVLYQTALDFAGLKGDETVADIYCGAGTISLLLAKHCKQVLGIEVVEPAVLNARENAKANGIENARFITGAAEYVLPRLVKEGYRPQVMVVDPPRKGIELPALEAMAASGPEKIVYVSCNPATQARDVGLLTQRGYKVTACQPVDMFAWTAGVENVALLIKA